MVSGERVGEGGKRYPFSVGILMLLVCVVQVYAVEAADGEREDELEEAEDGVGDVAHGHFAAADESHFRCSLRGGCGVM